MKKDKNFVFKNEPMMKLPSKISEIFELKGILPSAIRLFYKSDMGENMEFLDCYVVITDTELAVLEVLGGIFPKKTYNFLDTKKAETGIVERSFRTYSFAEYDNFRVEELLSGGRVVAREKAKEIDKFVFNFSNSEKDGAYVICRGTHDKNVTQQDFVKDNPTHSPKKEERRHGGLGGPGGPGGVGALGTMGGPMGSGGEQGSIFKRIKSGETKHILVKMFPFFNKYKFDTILVLIMVILSSLVALLAPYYSGSFFIDNVLSDKTSPFYSQIAVAIFIIAGTKLLSTVFTMIHSIVTAKISARVTYDLKKTIFKSIQRLSLDFFSSRQTGGLMTQINQDSRSIYWFFVDGLPYFITHIIQFITIVVLLFVMNFKITLVVLIPIPVFMIIRRSLYYMNRKIAARNHSRAVTFNSFVSDILSGNRVVKAFSQEKIEQKRFDKRSFDYADSIYDGTLKRNWIFYPTTLVLELGTYAAWAVGGYMVIKSTLDGSFAFTYGTLVTYISLLSMAYVPLDFFNHFSTQFSEFMNAAHRLFGIMDTLPSVRDKENPTVPEKFEGSVEFKNVSFEYLKNRRVIDNVSFKVEKGETIGIVGHTGAGKSTIVNLIMRLFDVTSGEVLIDSHNVKDLPMSYIRDNVAIVSQETYVFRGSVADNIRYACPDATDEEVISAAKTAGAHDFIVKYPDGYNTQIGFGNKGLSGGELQRLSIARAILKNPKILILDEATAAMDTATEQKIQKALTEITKDKTTIIIAHRLSTLKDADRLIVIENGKMTETGTHKELIMKKGDYHKLYKMQLEALKLIGVEE
ncbi:MAG: ABC transporter ATP-binding protein [Ruminococcaceae bacterium]|nr:ABC transporter ATP-binding protein [Oscillospiraceae bacterium]